MGYYLLLPMKILRHSKRTSCESFNSRRWGFHGSRDIWLRRLIQYNHTPTEGCCALCAHIIIVLSGALSANSAYGTLRRGRRQCPGHYKGIAHSSRPDLAKFASHNLKHVVFLNSVGFYDQNYALS